MSDARSDQVLAVLRSIDASLKILIRQSAPGPEVADDRDLDSKWGDPQVKFMPRDWTGDDFRNYRFSECPPSLLDMLADAFDYFARKAEETNETYNGKPVAPYKRKDAARARGWAKRLRAGYQPGPTRSAMPVSELHGDNEWPDKEEVPF